MRWWLAAGGREAGPGASAGPRAAPLVCPLGGPGGAETTARRATVAPRGRGTRGFGYDPMFVAEGQELTFGEMEPAEKHAMSHRANAFRLLLDGCFAGR